MFLILCDIVGKNDMTKTGQKFLLEIAKNENALDGDRQSAIESLAETGAANLVDTFIKLHDTTHNHHVKSYLLQAIARLEVRHHKEDK